MLDILQDQSVYRQRCTDSIIKVVDTYIQLYERYVAEYANGENYKPNDFQTGASVIHNVFAAVLTSTQNTEVAYKIGIVAVLYYIEFINQISKNIPTTKPPHSFLEGCENTADITYNDVVMFVYSKTLSNIKVTVSSSPVLVLSEYFFRLNQLMISACCDYEKVAKCIRKCVALPFTISQLQSMLIMVEYMMIERISITKILTLIYVYGGFVAKKKCNQCPSQAMKKVTNANFSFYAAGGSPYVFVKWFIKDT